MIYSQLLAQGGEPNSGQGLGGSVSGGQGLGGAPIDAAITNPVLGDLGTGANLQDGVSGGGNIIAWMIVTIWQVLMALAGILVIFYFIYGGITWLTAGGDKQKLENARNRIVNAIIGMALLFATFAVVNYLGPAIGFDLLQLKLPTP